MSHTAPPFDPAAVLGMLQVAFGASHSSAELTALMDDITPYLKRTTLPLEVAVPRIGANYLRDGARVRKLLSDQHAAEWQDVLAQVCDFARNNRRYPTELDASSWPDLDAFDDIKAKLDTYNFEGVFDHWVAVTVVRRLSRFWRDQQSLRVGGGGLRAPAERELARECGSYQSSPRTSQRSLNALNEADHQLIERLDDGQPPIGELVETAELQHLLQHCVYSFALARNDPALAQIWHAVIDRRMKLREVSVQFGLSIAQVNRRIEQVRAHLRQEPTLLSWLNSGD